MKPLSSHLKFGVNYSISVLLWFALGVVILFDLWVVYNSWSIVHAIDTGPAPIQVSRLARINFTAYDEAVKRLEVSSPDISISPTEGKFVGPQSPFGLPAEKE